ncbi:spore germination protein KB [Evansella caseinilytica]|uniref:Spore germination protein KB n=1 Tax=Evansella caseinilytica TaxID=1503961 RepID=A0A1H3GNB7_9BACI|nr:endospore germination permease [Evansella caseinilytica]SDY04540.1 spore germination protein KB [Evansella caseinilytica]
MKLSNIQLFWMIAIMELGMTLVMTTTVSLQAAKQDAWISVFFAGCIALLIAFVATRLTLLFPDQTLVQFSEAILGKWIGKIIVLIYLVQWYTIVPIVLRQFSDVIEMLLLQRTPSLAIILLMILLMSYVTFTGKIEGIGRCSEILGPMIFLMVFIVLFTNIENINVKNMLPLYVDNGMKNIMQGALAPASYLGHAVEIVMLTPFLTRPRQAAVYVVWGVVVPVVIVIVSTLMIIITIGTDLSVHMWYPFIELTREIKLGFIENWDAFAVVIWITSVFVKLSIYLFITTYGTAQFLKVENWRNMVWIIAPIILLFTFVPKNVTESTNNYLNNYWVPFVLPVNMIGIPLLLLVIGKMRQRKARANS